MFKKPISTVNYTHTVSDRKAHGNILHMTNYQINVNQNNIQRTLHTHYGGYNFKKWKIASVGKDIEILEPSNIAGGNKNYVASIKTNLAVPQEVKLEWPYNAAISLLCIYHK